MCLCFLVCSISLTKKRHNQASPPRCYQYGRDAISRDNENGNNCSSVHSSIDAMCMYECVCVCVPVRVENNVIHLKALLFVVHLLFVSKRPRSQMATVSHKDLFVSKERPPPHNGALFDIKSNKKGIYRDLTSLFPVPGIEPGPSG